MDMNRIHSSQPKQEFAFKVVEKLKRYLLEEIPYDDFRVKGEIKKSDTLDSHGQRESGQVSFKIRALVDRQISLFKWSQKALEVERWAEELMGDRDWHVEVWVNME